MAEQDKIEVQVDFVGAPQAARSADQVAEGLGHVDDKARAATASTAATATTFAQMATSGQQMAQRIQGAVGAVQSLVSALGPSDHTAGLIASAAGATAQFAAMGSMFGPAGTLIGGLAGLAAGVASVADEMNEGTTAAERYATALTTVQARVAARDARRRAEEIAAGRTGGLSGVELEAEIEARRARLAEIADERGAGIMEMLGFGDPERLEAETRRIREEIATLETAVTDFRNGLIVEEGTVEIIRENDPRYRTRDGHPRTGGGSTPAVTTTVDENERYRLESARIMTERLAETARVNEEMLDAEIARMDAETEARRAHREEERAMAQERIEETRRINEEELDAELERMERLEAREAEGRQAMKDAQTAQMEQQMAEREQMANELTGLLGQTTAALGKAVGSIILGEKSTEEAFKGLAAAFLEMISQYASLKAATEFADAAASFARYDYGGGAAHVGAGLAFTAVAVATGIGAAAINQPPAAPARPETAATQGTGGGGGDVVINWNSPVITAGTRAELGREIRTVVGEAAAL